MSRRKISEEMKSMKTSVDEASKAITEFAKINEKASKANEKMLKSIIDYNKEQKKALEEQKKANEEEKKKLENAKRTEDAVKRQQTSLEKLSSSVEKLRSDLEKGNITFDEFEEKLDDLNEKEKNIASITLESKDAYLEMKESLDKLNEASEKMAPNKAWIKLFDKIKENNKEEEKTNESWKKRVEYASALQKAVASGKISKEEVNEIDPNALKESADIVKTDKAIKGEEDKSAFGKASSEEITVLGAINKISSLKSRKERESVLKKAAESGNKEAKDKLSELKGEDATKRIGKAMDVFEKLGKKAFSSMVKYFEEVWQTTLNVASYSSSSSLITNSSAREQQLEWGLSDSQNYAFTQTKSLLGISSTEDLYYMNPSQRTKFYQLMEKYSSLYDQMNSSGTLASIQELQIDIEVMKQEFISELVSFIREHKSEIISAVRTGMVILKGLFSAVVSILNFIGKAFNIDTSEYENAVGSVTGSTLSSSSSTSSTSSLGSTSLASGYSEKISSAISSYKNVNDASYNTDNSSKTYNITINNEANVTKTGNEDAREITDSLSNSTAVALMNYLEG